MIQEEQAAAANATAAPTHHCKENFGNTNLGGRDFLTKELKIHKVEANPTPEAAATKLSLRNPAAKYSRKCSCPKTTC
jgi:hypothetical protein